MGPIDMALGAGTKAAPSDHWSADLIGDDELERLALAADPNTPVDPDATPVAFYLDSLATAGDGDPALPEWYMAPVRARLLAGWARVVILSVVAAFLVIEAVGLCSTFGQPPLH
jgi:hypothetical protein